MLSSEYTVVLATPIRIQSYNSKVAVTVRLFNSDPSDSRTVDFFIEIGTFRSRPQTVRVESTKSQMTRIPVLVRPDSYIARVYAKTDKNDSVSIESISACNQ